MSGEPLPPPADLAVEPTVFQRLMLQWERLAPYNAAQYATMDVDVDHDRAMRAWRDASITLGLQQIGQPPNAFVEPVDQPIERFVTGELNRPFRAGDAPLRPFIHRDAAGVVSLGLFYRHVIADSASIRLLVRAWLERLLSPSQECRNDRHIRLLRDRMPRPLDSRRQWSVLREFAADISRVSRAKRVRRLPATADPTSAVAWRRVELPNGTADRLRSYARRKGVRVNDLFVTAAALACDRYVPDEGIDARSDISIGTIADVRPIDRPADEYFGLMLGFLQTFWRQSDLWNWPRALAVASAQSRIARERSIAQASVLRLFTALRVNAKASREELANFYRKRCPLAAGISNVNLNNGWPAELHPSPVKAYTRVSPLGPMLPLVFTPTTLGQSLHLGVTHRTSVLTHADVDHIVEAFIRWLTAL